MRVCIIAAVSRNGVIGVGGGLPWRLPDEMAFFKRTTMGHPVVMGRTTWESLRAPLVGRTNLVLSRRPGYEARGGEVVPDLATAIARGRELRADDLFVIGGAQVYEVALPLADRLYLTRVDAVLEGDTFFPVLGEEWIERARTDHAADARHAWAFSMCLLER